MKKVCHVTSGYLRDDARIFYRQCKSLKNNGYEVSILTNDGQKDERIEGINIYSTDYWPSRIKVLLFAKNQFIKKLHEIDADIYQLHSPELLSIVKTLKNKNKIVIYDAHEDLPSHIKEKEWIPKFLRNIISKIFKIYMNYIFEILDEIISPCDHVIQKTKLIKNSTRITNFPIIRSSKKISKNNFIERKNIICYTGTVYRYTNQQEILKALSNIRDIEYHIAGFIDEEFLNILSQLNSFNKLNYYGKISKLELQKFYNKSLIGFVVYDYKLNLGYKLGSYGTNKIFEYMEAGLPIICTDYILWKEIIDKYDCGICVEPNNYKQIENAIKFLISNKEKAYEMGQNGRKAILNEYNWVSQEKLYLGIFKKYNHS